MMTYTDDDIEKQLALLRRKDLPTDVMRLLYSNKNRNSSFKRMNDPVHIQSDQLLPFRNYSLFNISDVNTHHNWCNQSYYSLKYGDHWHHKYAYTPKVSFFRSPGALHSDTHVTHHMPHVTCHCQMPLDPEVDDESLRQNMQNNACDDDDDDECEEENSDDHCQANSELNEVYEKIRRLADLQKHQALKAGCYEPYLGNLEGLESPSVLSPPTEPPHTRSLVRVKPYKRHQMYQRMWKVQPAIGDNFRFSLRQKIRQKMLQEEKVQLPHKMFVPNMYVVPTMKPRYQLRWIVRKCNHDYKMPPCGIFHDD
ncbi:hypothetical protein BsWGS_10713 [Bradybaena similaris]